MCGIDDDKRDVSCAVCVTKAGVVARRGDRYLVVFGLQHKKWSFPKGYIEPGENWTQAARRELREETGYIVRCLPPKPEIYCKDVVLYSICMDKFDTTGSAMHRDKDEIGKVRWKTIDEIRKLPYKNRSMCHWLRHQQCRKTPLDDTRMFLSWYKTWKYAG